MAAVTTFEPKSALGTSTVRVFQARDGRPWLDVDLTALSPELGAYFGVRHGVLVTSTSQSSLGLRDGDVLLKINGSQVGSPQEALTMFAGSAPNEPVTLEVRRKGEVFTLSSEAPSS
jgi:S1-C subfamily serine protease